MAKTQVDKYTTASRRNTTYEMTKRNGVKRSDSSSSTHSSLSQSENNRSGVKSSMRKFLSDDDEFDYLGSLTQGSNSKEISKHSTSSRKRTPPSYKKKNPNAGDRRAIVPRSSRSTKPRSIRKKPDVHEGNLNDVKESAKNLMSSARKLVVKAARSASPGRLRRDRSKSPGPQKTRNSMRAARSTSPTSSRTDPASPNTPPSSRKKRSKSPGRLKKRVSEGEEENDAPKSSKGRARSKSPGKMKGRARSKSPGKMKKRSQSPGALRRTDRPRRRPENRDENGSARRRARSHSNGPLKKDRPRSTKSRGRGVRSTRSNDDLESESGHNKQESYSNMQDEFNRHKVKRNKSMDAGMAHRARLAAQEIEDEDEDDRCPPRRANSMMLSREKGRRGKSNSLADLVQYKEEEIHSTSYFASNHVLVNRERMKRGLRPLTRNIAMDDLARKSAQAMASSNGLNALPTTYVGNVLRGETIRTIHRSTMLQKQGRERANILNPYFQDFGVGTCKGSDGNLYMCQLFSERLELALTDTKNMEESSDH